MNENFFRNFFEKWKSAWLMAGIIFLVFFLSYEVLSLYKKASFVGFEEFQKQEELSRLEVQRETLQSDVDFLKSQSAVEREAKKNLNYKKPGEEVIIVVPKTDRSGATASFEKTIQSKNWFDFLKNIFK